MGECDLDELQLKSAKRHKADEPLAVAWLYEQYAPRVLAYLLRCGFPHNWAQDMVQETFVSVLKSLHTFDETKGTLGGWIATIARNLANRHWKKHAPDMNFDTQLAQEVFACDDRPDQDLDQQEEMTALDDCIALLPDEMATLIRMRYIQSYTTRGMAITLGLAESTIRARLKLAIDHLHHCMNDKGFDAT